MISKIFMYLELLFSNSYSKKKVYSRYLGIKFGKNVRITHFPRWGSEPYLIEIGNNVTITRGVCFINHDGGAAILREKYPNINVYGKIIIGNNVFIGINSIILPNVNIGDNVVIGAGSIITKDVPNNVTVAGVPAKVISSINKYKNNIKKNGIILNYPKHQKKKKNEILNKINFNF